MQLAAYALKYSNPWNSLMYFLNKVRILHQLKKLELEGMFLFKKSSKGAYWYNLCDSGERHGFCSCYGRIKTNSAAKQLVTNRNIKEGHQIVRQAYHYIPYFFKCQNDHRLDATINFGSVSFPPTALKSTNDSL